MANKAGTIQPSSTSLVKDIYGIKVIYYPNLFEAAITLTQKKNSLLTPLPPIRFPLRHQRIYGDKFPHCQYCIDNRLNCNRSTLNEQSCRRCVDKGIECIWPSSAWPHVADEMHGVQYGIMSGFASTELEDSCDIPIDFETQMFACPFFQKDPMKFSNEKTCSGPGYAEIYRLKEHLYRKHMRKLRCNRCYQVMESESAFEAHIRLPIEALCHAVDPPKTDTDGISQDQVKQLKANKRRKQQYQTDIDSWKEIYRILFGPIPDTEMPSPYAEFKIPGGARQILFHEADKYGQFIRLETITWLKTWINRLIKENPDIFPNDDVKRNFDEAEPLFKITSYELYRKRFEQRARTPIKTTGNARQNALLPRSKDFAGQQSPPSVEIGSPEVKPQESMPPHSLKASNGRTKNPFVVQHGPLQAAVTKFPEMDSVPVLQQPRALKQMKSVKRLQSEKIDYPIMDTTSSQYSSAQTAKAATYMSNASSFSSSSLSSFRPSNPFAPQLQANSPMGNITYTVGREGQLDWDQLGV